jgi:hypothetical protein
MNAQRLVIIAAALTVAAALATALVTVSGQALPRAVRHDLTGASGTADVAGRGGGSRRTCGPVSRAAASTAAGSSLPRLRRGSLRQLSHTPSRSWRSFPASGSGRMMLALPG